MEEAKEIKFEIVKKFGVLSESGRGWRKEANLVSWNDRDPKLDIRDWAEDHTRMGKGVTLNRDEAVRLYEYLGAYLKI
jgi:hypothetical protein